MTGCDTRFASPDALDSTGSSQARSGRSLLRQVEENLRGSASLSSKDPQTQNEVLRRSLAELAVAHSRYLDLYDLAPIGYCTVNEEGLLLEINLTAAGLLGVPRETPLNEPITRFILQEDHDAYHLHCKQLSRTRAPQVCELRMVKVDGTAFWARLTATVGQGADGTPVHLVTITDIDELKRAEAALRTSEGRYCELVNRMSSGVAV